MGAQSTSLMDAIMKVRRNNTLEVEVLNLPIPPSPPPLEVSAKPVPTWWTYLKRGQRILFADPHNGEWHYGRSWEIYENGEKIGILFDHEPKMPKFVAVSNCWL
jgi:hypothetical protein